MVYEIEIFSDEIIYSMDFNKKRRNILGICCFFIPVNSEQVIVKKLLELRCLKPENKGWSYNFEQCPNKDICKPEWHKLNNCEIHWKELCSSSSIPSKKIAKRWLNFFVNRNRSNEAIFFNLLFLELDKISSDRFGESKIHENIYNKFFRTTIHYGIKSFFSDSKVIIKNVFHDTGNMEDHNFFPSFNLNKLNKEIKVNIKIKNKEITFVDSDHKKYINNERMYYLSNMIQFVDLVLGSISQCLFYLSDDPLKKEIASLIYPLVERLMKKPWNYKSSWHYAGKQNISFFPRSPIDDIKIKSLDLSDNILKGFKGQFHRNKELEMPFYDTKQQNLNSFIKN